ncbi:MAG: hypothetical protein KDJ52_35125, partial [Anaerolineae bacterium]|nr:hypothetical protein [Anaerolineae bacterium]
SFQTRLITLHKGHLNFQTRVITFNKGLPNFQTRVIRQKKRSDSMGTLIFGRKVVPWWPIGFWGASKRCFVDGS